MIPLLDDPARFWQAEAARFARRRVAGRDDLFTDEFPFDLWREMAAAGFPALGLPKEYGGKAGGALALAAAGEAFVREGGCLGLALSWGLNTLVAGFLIDGHGTKEQKREYIPFLADGRRIGCLAVSEPGVGGHPGKLTTTAVLQGEVYVLNGEKTYLTNGPIADLYVVMAVTGQRAGRNEITAFLVDRTMEGVIQGDRLPLDFLKPSPHGGLHLRNAAVTADRVLGPPGGAYPAMIRPFRVMEDALLMGPMAGALARRLDLTAEWLKRIGASPSDEGAACLGRMEHLVYTARLLAFETARARDRGVDADTFWPGIPAGREVVRRFETENRRLLETLGLEEPGDLARLSADVNKTNRIAGNVLAVRQIKRGLALLR